MKRASFFSPVIHECTRHHLLSGVAGALFWIKTGYPIGGYICFFAGQTWITSRRKWSGLKGNGTRMPRHNFTLQSEVVFRVHVSLKQTAQGKARYSSSLSLICAFAETYPAQSQAPYVWWSCCISWSMFPTWRLLVRRESYSRKQWLWYVTHALSMRLSLSP